MNYTFLSAAVIAAAVFTGCSSSDDVPVKSDGNSITADLTSITVPAEGATYTVNLGVKGTGNKWNSIVPVNSWVTMSPDNGYDKSGHYKLTVTAAPNTDTSQRSEEICIYTAYDNLKIKVTQEPFVREGCCQLTESEINIPAANFAYRTVGVTTYEDVDVTVDGGEWLQFAGLPATVVKSGSNIELAMAPDGPYTSARTAKLIFTGKESGEVTTLTVNHEAITKSNALPTRWYYANEDAESGEWTGRYGAVANYDAGKGRSYVTVVGVNNRKIDHSVATAYKKSIAASGLYTGDYLLFSIPSDNLAAGTGVDFMMTISSADNSAPKYWLCEIWDGGQWRMPKDSDLRSNADGDKYSFYTKYFSSYQHASFTQSFTLENPVTDGLVRVRCRVVGKRNGADGTLNENNYGEIYLPSHEFHFCSVAAYPGIPTRDVKKVGILGNSFTHYFATAFLLKEIARSQGHQLDIRIHAKGSQTFANHVNLERSLDVINETGYDYVILQEQSTTYSTYAETPTDAPVADCKALTARLRSGSPSAKVILENTWAFPQSNGKWSGYGSSAAFEAKLLAGTKAVASADENVDWISPIGVAFTKAYESGITDLFYTDSKHPSRNGAYLKSCVNYLVIFGERFDANVSDGGCDSTVAARLRAIAEETVLGNESEYSIKR